MRSLYNKTTDKYNGATISRACMTTHISVLDASYFGSLRPQSFMKYTTELTKAVGSSAFHIQKGHHSNQFDKSHRHRKTVLRSNLNRDANVGVREATFRLSPFRDDCPVSMAEYCSTVYGSEYQMELPEATPIVKHRL